MLAISTSFIPSWDYFSGKDLIERLECLAISAVELEYRIPASRYADVKEKLKSANIAVTSIHNFFPFSTAYPNMRPSGDLFNLADLDSDLRKLAVEGTMRSIDHANDLEVNKVVIHGGWVEFDHCSQKFAEYLTQKRVESQAYQLLIQQKFEVLEQKKKKHLSNLLFSLEKLLKRAEKEGVWLGLENRYHYYQLPTFEDFDLIFKEFQGAPIGYWHDTGHAHALEQLKLLEPGSLLKKYSKHLLGMHLHDAVGLEDHMAPGKGEINLVDILSKSPVEAAFVMELKPGTNESDIRSGHQHLSPNLPK